MKLNIQSILAQLSEGGVSLEDRGYLLSIALGRALAYNLALPLRSVENPWVEYTTLHKAYVENQLSLVNERIVIDIGTTSDLVCRLWVFRYRLAFDAKNSAVKTLLDSMIKVGDREVPAKLSEFLIKYSGNELIENVTRMVEISMADGA